MEAQTEELSSLINDETKKPDIVDPYQKIAEFLYSIKLANLVNSIEYCGAVLDPVYTDKKEMVVEAYLLLIEQVAIEEIVLFLPTKYLHKLMLSVKLNVDGKDKDKDIERMLEYIFNVGLSSFIYKNLVLDDIALLCSHFDIPVRDSDILNVSMEENTEENGPDTLNIPQLKETAIVNHRYRTWLMDEIVLRGFRSSMFDQSLAITREWIRDIGGQVAGSKMNVIDRVLSSVLASEITETSEDLTDARILYQNSIVERLRTKSNTKKKSSLSSSLGSPKNSPKSIKAKGKKPKRTILSRAERRNTPVPHPDEFVQDLDYHGGKREPIIRGVEFDVLMTKYNHAELRSYCSFFRLNQTGKKTTLVDRIIDFLETYDYSKKGESESSPKDDKDESESDDKEDKFEVDTDPEEEEEEEEEEKESEDINLTGKREFEGETEEPAPKKMKLNDATILPVVSEVVPIVPNQEETKEKSINDVNTSQVDEEYKPE